MLREAAPWPRQAATGRWLPDDGDWRRHAFDLSSDGLAIHEAEGSAPAGTFVQTNDALCRLLGYTAEEMGRLTPLDIMLPEAGAGETPYPATLRAQDGRSIPAEIHGRRFERDGRQMAQNLARLRRLRPDLPVMMSSGYNEAECLRLLEGQRISGFLQKPYTASTLGAMVKAALPREPKKTL